MTTTPTARAWADAARRSAERAHAALDRGILTRVAELDAAARHAVCAFHALHAAECAADRADRAEHAAELDAATGPCARSWATLARLHADAAEALAGVSE